LEILPLFICIVPGKKLLVEITGLKIAATGLLNVFFFAKLQYA
jgi:hypothetical protein